MITLAVFLYILFLVLLIGNHFKSTLKTNPLIIFDICKTWKRKKWDSMLYLLDYVIADLNNYKI